MMNHFAKILTACKSLTIFAKISIVDVWQSLKHVSADIFTKSNKKDTASNRQIHAVLMQFTYLYLVIKGTVTLQM